MKTKRIDRCDLPASSFAYVGDPDDTSTWKLPINFPGDSKRTVNHVKDALGRFGETRGIPDSEHSFVWFTLFGAATALGIRIEDQFLQHQPIRLAPAAERHEVAPAVEASEPVVVQTAEPAKEQVLTTRRIKELEAMADARADEILTSLGLN